MPIVQIDMLEGRTVDQRRELVKKVTEAITESVSCPASAVTIIIREMTKEHLGQAGKLRADS
ncbi:2-hydroxymuconate tautomerase family protein|uniref:Tautomerase n=1 Tax=Dendrosporobacter quercicolus TaxID=146817 RepID=A0A1G9M357_9FIRM|nr:2-hydroxymuconate tautomerase [Dendrosporobacter quercicolus]NSL46884.1 2-hydroxymuconate tautomerase family protein [Dendrosporobacter quercicolus DSM 1736]SDL68115.1 4-oxalocrotonate tautomerase [Dendrosporobacter quercicolus]